MMRSFGTPLAMLDRGEGCLGVGRRRQPLPRLPRRASPSTRSATRIRCSSRRSASQAARSRTSRTTSPPSRSSSSPSGSSASRAPASAAGCTSATPAPRPTRRHSSSRACTAASERAPHPHADRRLPRPHDGRARPHRQAGHAASPSSRCPAGSSTSTPPSRRSSRRSTTRVAALFVEPIQGEAGVRDLPDGYLRAGARAHRASTARCSSSTRSRPAPVARAAGSPSSTPT